MAFVISIILSVFSILILVIPMGLCVWLGYKRGWFNSALRLGCSIVAALLAFLVARLIAPALGAVLVSEVLGSAFPEEIISMLTQAGLLNRIVGGLTAPLTFCFLYLIVDKLMLFVYFPLKKKFKENEALHNAPHDRLYGALLGGVLALTITLTCLMPLGGYLGFTNQVIDSLSTISNSEEVLDEETEVIFSSTVVKVDYAVSGWLFRGLAADTCSTVNDALSILEVVTALEDTENPDRLADTLQNLPAKTVAKFSSIAKTALKDAIPEDQKILNSLVDGYLDALSNVTSLSKEEYSREMSALTTLISAIQDPDSATPETAVKAALSSTILNSVIVENEKELKAELSEATKSMSKAEKQEMATAIDDFAKEADVDTKTIDVYKSILGLD